MKRAMTDFATISRWGERLEKRSGVTALVGRLKSCLSEKTQSNDYIGRKINFIRKFFLF